jgi:hypothetical protein
MHHLSLISISSKYVSCFSIRNLSRIHTRLSQQSYLHARDLHASLNTPSARAVNVDARKETEAAGPEVRRAFSWAPEVLSRRHAMRLARMVSGR